MVKLLSTKLSYLKVNFSLGIFISCINSNLSIPPNVLTSQPKFLNCDTISVSSLARVDIEFI